MSRTRPQIFSDHSLEGDDAVDSSQTKRRKVRRGTRSCWECRRRKMKCIFASPADTVCSRCQRRGTKCVGQEFPEQVSSSVDRNLQMGDRVGRVEALVEQLIEQGSKPPYSNSLPTQDQEDEQLSSFPTPAASSDDHHALYQSHNSVGNKTKESAAFGREGHSRPPNATKYRSEHSNIDILSHSLIQALPTNEDIEIIVRGNGNTSTFFYQMLITPYDSLDSTKDFQAVFETPLKKRHPVLIARCMIHMATFLQHLHPDLYKELDGLSERPHDMMNRLAEAAITFVSTNDDLMSCVEGLDTLMTASWYRANAGQLKKGLVLIRRAITIAQLMGFHRSGPGTKCEVADANTKAYPEVIWFRILSIERYLCLMLGLPQGSLDRSMASESMLAQDTPMARLDRIHCAIASRILERNQSDPSPQDFNLTHELDGNLQQAAAELPSKWWLNPNLASTADNPEEMFWNMRRIFHQLFHYNLLIQLHLPYMIRSSADGQKYEYSRITCVNASREVLSRYLMFQSFNRIAFCCRTVDFFCLMASMTLLLAHIDGHRRSPTQVAQMPGAGHQMSIAGNLLAHQRPSDRALIEQAHESMEEIKQLFGDSLSVQTADLLRGLMTVELEAASGQPCRIEGSRQKANATDEMTTSETGRGFQIVLPHFGSIKITREGVISKGMPRSSASQPQQMRGKERNAQSAENYWNGESDRHTQTETGIERSYVDSRPQHSSKGLNPVPPDLSTNLPGYETSNIAPYQEPPSVDSSSQDLQQICNQIFDSTSDDGDFQGIDMAFFDTLMRGASDDATEWPAWMNEA